MTQPFAMVPESVLRWQLTPAEFRLWVALALHADEQRHARPSQGRLAELVGCSTRRVQQILADLEAKGAIEKVGVFGPKRFTVWRLRDEAGLRQTKASDAKASFVMRSPPSRNSASSDEGQLRQTYEGELRQTNEAHLRTEQTIEQTPEQGEEEAPPKESFVRRPPSPVAPMMVGPGGHLVPRPPLDPREPPEATEQAIAAGELDDFDPAKLAHAPGLFETLWTVFASSHRRGGVGARPARPDRLALTSPSTGALHQGYVPSLLLKAVKGVAFSDWAAGTLPEVEQRKLRGHYPPEIGAVWADVMAKPRHYAELYEVHAKRAARAASGAPTATFRAEPPPEDDPEAAKRGLALIRQVAAGKRIGGAS